MKRSLAIILAAFITLFTTACNHSKSSGELSNVAPTEIAPKIVEACGRDLSSFTEIHQFLDEGRLLEYVANKYEIIISSGDDISIYSADMPDAFEIAVFRFENSEEANKAVEMLTKYISSVEEEYALYEPEQAYIVHNSISVSAGRYAALLICEETASAKETFENAVNGKLQS